MYCALTDGTFVSLEEGPSKNLSQKTHNVGWLKEVNDRRCGTLLGSVEGSKLSLQTLEMKHAFLVLQTQNKQQKQKDFIYRAVLIAVIHFSRKLSVFTAMV